jgi:hypothetical protein
MNEETSNSHYLKKNRTRERNQIIESAQFPLMLH